MENLKKFCKEKSITFFFPIALILTIVPLIVRLKEVKSDDEVLAIFGNKATSDLFSQDKAIVLMFLSALVLIIAITCFKHIFSKKDKVVTSIVVLSFVFLVLSLISTLSSQHRKIALWGIFDRAEGFITIACYILLFIYSIYAFKTANDYKYVLIPLSIVVFVNAFLGLFQFTGNDLLATGLGKVFANINPKTVKSLYDSGNLYGTLFHYNYVGSFAAIVIPILFGGLFFEDDVFLKITLIGAGLCSIWLLLGSTSRAGLLGVGATILLALIIFGKQVIKRWKPVLIAVAIILVFITGLNFATGNKLFSRIPTLVSDGLSIFKDTSDFDYTEHIPIKDILHKDKDVQVILQNDSLNISYDNGEYIFKNSKDEVIDYQKNTDSKTKVKTLNTTDKRYSNISFRFGQYVSKTRDDGLLLFLNNKPAFMFLINDDGTIHMINGTSKKEIEIEHPETIGFNGKEKLASARGYIWSRSLPLLKDSFFIGKGPDTFALYFPQNDLIGKLYAYDSAVQIVDKPHNLYLQTAFSNGILSLIAFLGMIIIYIVDSLKLYALKKEYKENEIMGIITFLGVIGYLFAGIFNDSIISVAPVFWIVFGTGIAINHMNKSIDK